MREGESVPYFPMIASATPYRKYRFAGYAAVLLHKVRSAQTIQYNYVLFVRRQADKELCLAVASEYSDPISRAEPFLGVFPGEGHINLGGSERWRDVEAFAAEAVRVALEQLNLPPDEPVQSEDAPQRPWWKFW